MKMNELIINGEECMPIPNYSRYVVSITGRIYRTTPINKKEAILYNSGREDLYFHEVSKTMQYGRGKYPSLKAGMKRNGDVLTTVRVGNIVAIAFGIYPKHPANYMLKYRDGDPYNCFLANLEFVKRQPGNSILSKSDVKEIRKLIGEGLALRKIGEMFGVCEMQIGRIKTGENWGTGKRKILPPQAPFHIEDGKKRRLLASFRNEKIGANDLFRYFTIKRDSKDPTNNLMMGIVNGYKFKKRHLNISRARVIVYELNKYFFNDKAAERQSKKIEKRMSHKNLKDLHELAYAK